MAKLTVAELAAQLAEVREELNAAHTMIMAHEDDINAMKPIVERSANFMDWYKKRMDARNQSQNNAAPTPPAVKPQQKQAQQKPQPARPQQQTEQPQQNNRNIRGFLGRRNQPAKQQAVAGNAAVVTSWQDYATYMAAVREKAIKTGRTYTVTGYAEARHTPLQDLIASIN